MGGPNFSEVEPQAHGASRPNSIDSPIVSKEFQIERFTGNRETMKSKKLWVLQLKAVTVAPTFMTN